MRHSVISLLPGIPGAEHGHIIILVNQKYGS